MNLCITFLSFSKDIFGGIENSIFNLSQGLIKNNHKVIIYSSYLNGNETFIEGIKVYRSQFLPKKLPIDSLAADKLVTKALLNNAQEISIEIAHIIKIEKINTVICIDPLWGIIPFTINLREFKCCLVLSLHVVNSKQLLLRALKGRFDLVLYVSKSLKSKVDKKVKYKPFAILPNSINSHYFKPVENVGRKSRIIFCNSRIASGKGINFLINGFKLFLLKYPELEFELWLCNGNSPFGDKHLVKPTLEKQIRSLELESRVKFLPNIKWNEIPNIIRESFAVVLPSLYESFGIAALETLACGVPLIATRVGNIPDLTKGSALLISPRSPKAIFLALSKLVDDQNLYSNMCKRGILIAKNYDSKHVAKQFITILENINHDKK